MARRRSEVPQSGPPVRFTDDELAFLRHVRFGELPERVPPSELVALVETEPPHEVGEQAFDPRRWGEAGRLL